VSRGLRFFLVSYLAYKYGAAIGPFLEKKGVQATLIITAILFIIAAVLYLIFK
jgi:hypothetical protein